MGDEEYLTRGLPGRHIVLPAKIDNELVPFWQLQCA
jgi:hypothetical protein